MEGNGRLAGMSFAGVDNDQAGERGDVLAALIVEFLQALFDHADDEIIVHVALEGIGDEIGSQQTQAQVRHLPDLGAFTGLGILNHASILLAFAGIKKSFALLP
jgi:hypothetical protein